MISDASELFAWLRSLSFIESGPAGVFPHDLTREVIESDLRWRSPERFRQLHDDVRRGIVRRLRHGSLAQRQSAFSDLIFLHRDNPIMRPLYQWDLLGAVGASPATPDDHDLLIDIVRRQQGSASAAMVKYWMQRQPDGFSVFRDAAGGEIIGFACMLEIAAATEEDCRADPAVAAATRYASDFGPPRPEESMVYGRWLLSRSTPVPSDTPGLWEAICMINVIRWVETPRLSWSFVATDRSRPVGALLQPYPPDAGPAGRVQRRRPWLRGLRP